MHAVTIRRSLVFVVCALGVGSLYLAPSVVGSPHQSGQLVASDEPVTRPVRTVDAKTISAQSGGPPPSSEPVELRQPVGRERTASGESGDETSENGAPWSQRTRRGATAYDKDTDAQPPQPVQRISTSTITADRFSIDWPAAADNVRVVGYHIWLNGFEVAATVQTQATVQWFNDDSQQSVVQVKAVDAAGNQSETSPTVLVTRPVPGPTPEPTDAPTKGPDPTSAPSRSSQPSAAPKARAAAPKAQAAAPKAQAAAPKAQAAAPSSEAPGASEGPQ